MKKQRVKKLKDLAAKTKLRKNKPELNEKAPRITNETVAAHREEVLGSARKYIYPLQHSKHRIVIVSVFLFIVTSVLFFTYATLALYKFKSTSTFIYRVTQVVPFPIARAGKRFVAYENYLFEVRRYVHYYESQLQYDFDEPSKAPQLEDYKRKALDKVINDAYIKQIAEKHNITVSAKEVDDYIIIVRQQGRIGSADEVYRDVLREYFGWSENDLKRSLRSELLAQKVVAKLDTETNQKAKKALGELRSGADFAEVAKKYSDDKSTNENGGEMPGLIDKTNRDLSAQTTDALFRLKKDQISDIVHTPFSLEILKNLGIEGNKIRAAHILFQYKDVSEFTKGIKKENPPRKYIIID